MALCEYAAQVGGQCGASGENPGSSQCISIAKCDKDIRSHLRSVGAGFHMVSPNEPTLSVQLLEMWMVKISYLDSLTYVHCIGQFCFPR